MFVVASAMCCAPAPLVELDVLVDLALALALGGLVDRELDLALAVRHDLRHERRVLGLDLVVAEVEDVRHPEDALVELDPVVHLAELDVSDDVVDVREAEPPGNSVRRRRYVPRLERPGVVAAVHERVNRVAVRRDRRGLDRAEVVLERLRLGDAARAALRRLPVRLRRVGDGERDVAHAVAVPRLVARDLVVLVQRRREDEADVALLEHVGRAVADAGLRPRVRRARESHRVLVEVRGLLGVPDPELEVVPAEHGHEIVGHSRIMTRPSARPTADAGSARRRCRRR